MHICNNHPKVTNELWPLLFNLICFICGLYLHPVLAVFVHSAVIQAIIKPLARHKLFWVKIVKQDIKICFLFVSEYDNVIHIG